MDKDNVYSYFLAKIYIDSSFAMISKGGDAYQFDSFNTEVDWIIEDTNMHDNYKSFLIYLAICCYAIRSKKKIPESIINALKQYIENNFFENNINHFQIDEDYEDILRDYENVKSIFA
jgi:hypothetical protein